MKSERQDNVLNSFSQKDEKLNIIPDQIINREKYDESLQSNHPKLTSVKEKKGIKHNKCDLSGDFDLVKSPEKIINEDPELLKLESFCPIEKPKILPIEMVDCLFQYPEQYQLLVLNEKLFNIVLRKNEMNERKKYVICQLLESKSSKSDYLLYIRSGKLEGISKSSASKFFNLDLALKKFKYLSNYWIKRGYVQEGGEFLDRINFKEKPLILKEISLKRDANFLKRTLKKSKLEANLQEVLGKMLIDNNKGSKIAAENSGFDVKKLPYSKLTKNRISLGNRQLAKISDVLDNPLEGNLIELSKKFLESIPHVFGVPHLYDFVINSKPKLDVELEMMENLENIRISNKLISLNKGSFNYLLDSYYERLKIKINLINKKAEEFKILEMMVKNTKGPSHNFFCEIITAFKIDRPIDKLKYLKNIGNDHLLFFTAKFHVFSKHFLLKKETENKGSESSEDFANGISFTDIITQATTSCRTKNEEKTGLILVCKVALGNITHTLDPESKKDKLEEGKNSRVILGKYLPDPTEVVEFEGSKIFCGKMITIKDKTKQDYSDYIVYDEDQIQMKYLLFINIVEDKSN